MWPVHRHRSGVPGSGVWRVRAWCGLGLWVHGGGRAAQRAGVVKNHPAAGVRWRCAKARKRTVASVFGGHSITLRSIILWLCL